MVINGAKKKWAIQNSNLKRGVSKILQNACFPVFQAFCEMPATRLRVSNTSNRGAEGCRNLDLQAGPKKSPPCHVDTKGFFRRFSSGLCSVLASRINCSAVRQGTETLAVGFLLMLVAGQKTFN